MVENNKRIDLLSPAEIEDLYVRPVFNDEERLLYFTLNEQETCAAMNYSNERTRLYFILQLGYFKAKQRFFSFSLDEVITDAEYVSAIFLYKKISISGKISREYIKKQKEDVLILYDYKQFSAGNEKEITQHLCGLLKIYPKAHNTLRQLMVHFNQCHIILPKYRTLQNLFTKAYGIEKKRLNEVMSSIPGHIQSKLQDLIKSDNSLTELNIIRSDQKNFQYTAIKLEVEKAEKITELYQFAKLFIPTMEISKNAITYYSNIAEQYSPFRLRKLLQPRQWLHLICFVYHRYQQLMNNLITSFKYHVRNIISDGKGYAEKAQIEHSSNLAVDFPKLAEFLKWFPEQKNRPDVTYATLSEDAYKILPEEQFIPLSELISGNTFDKKSAKWQFYAKSSRLFALYLRPILTAVEFTYYEKEHPITDMINVLKKHYKAGKTPASLKLCNDLELTVPKAMLEYLKKNPDDKTLDPHRFEFYVYYKMYHHLDRGRLFCNDSISYCDLECDLVPDKVVDDVEAIAKKYGYHNLPIYCDAYLDNMLGKLDAAWDRTTKGIYSGENTGINIKLEKNVPTWTLSYDTSDKLDKQFLSGLPKVEISNLIKFVGDTIGIWEKFTHNKNLYIKRKNADPLYLNAGILAEAFGFSMKQMAEISDLNYNILQSTREDFFNVTTLSDTNDAVADFIRSLPIFKTWDLIDNQTLADADGQKIASTNSTIQSRYSKKFLGKGKGISIYTLLANFVAVNATNIGPNEYEGHSLYDMIYGNKTDITIDMVTGDGHSKNKYNFVFLNSIDVDYVPSIKNIREAANNLYSVKSPDSYNGILIPKNKINVDRIKTEKRAILRVLLSLLMQDNTQTTIVRKLNSHTRYTRLRAALEEYNKLLDSTHILNIIHDIQLRKVLKTARNRTESYHSLQGLIRKVYNGVFKGNKIANNQISAHATRLVANCIVAYNSIILNSIYIKMIKSGVSPEMLKAFARISPIAWSHLVFTGRYNFAKSDGRIDIEFFVEQLESELREWFGVDNKTPGTV